MVGTLYTATAKRTLLTSPSVNNKDKVMVEDINQKLAVLCRTVLSRLEAADMGNAIASFETVDDGGAAIAIMVCSMMRQKAGSPPCIQHEIEESLAILQKLTRDFEEKARSEAGITVN
jgi:hypothetical protein